MNTIVSIAANLPTIDFELLRKEVPVLESPIVKSGDVLEFPNYEDIVIRRQDGPNNTWSYFATVLRNNKRSLILIKRISHVGTAEQRCTYSLTQRFGYYNNDLRELLKFLGDLERPITVHDNCITW